MNLNRTKEIRIGIIGCGWIMKKVHIPVFENIPNTKICAIYDKNNEVLKNYKHRPDNVKLYCDIEKFFSENLDAVIIGTPNSLHSYYTRESLIRGIHVLCEKPVCLSSNEAKELIELAKKKKLIYLPAYVNRFRKDIGMIYKEIKRGKIGKLISIEAKWVRKNGIPRAGGWNTNYALAGGGVLQDLGSHIIDLCIYFAECDVMCDYKAKFNVAQQLNQKGALWMKNQGEDYNFDVETRAEVEMYMMNGVKIDIFLDWASESEGDYTEFCIVGNKGKVKLYTLFGFSTNYSGDNKKKITIENDESIIEYCVDNVSQVEAFYRQACYFVDCINNDDYMNMNCDCVYPTVNIIEQLYKCM